MKKLFVCVMASLCSAFAFAQTDEIVMEDVNLSSGGTETLYVKLKNPTKYTAFQFDLTLPKGVSVEGVGIGGNVPNTREKEYALINKETNTYRFLSYDMENANLDENASLKISLKAAEDAAEGVAETAEALVVTSDGTSTDQDVASANVTIMEGITITIPAGEKLAMVSDKNLDFTSLEAKGVKAYICTGNEKTGEKDKFWLTRVNDVPANTPIMIKGPAGDYDIPEGSASIYYPDNFLVGSASAASSLDWDGYKNYAVILDKGTIAALPTSVKSFDAGKAYFHVPATIASNVAGSDQEFTIPAGGKLAMVSDYDLDFNDVSFKAYTVTGYGKNRKIWMTRVMKACAGTPLMLFGSAGTYSIPSSLTANATYVNMLLGNTSDESVILNPTMDDKTILVVILASGTIAKLGASNAPFGKGKAWLPVPTSYYESGIASTRGLGEMTFEEPEVICLTVESDATGINTVAVEKELEADAWYNLNGQRISKPNKKGLYILNGKKVIVK